MRATVVMGTVLVGVCLAGCGGSGGSGGATSSAASSVSPAPASTTGTSSATRDLARLDVSSASVTADGALRAPQLSGRYGMSGGQDRSPALSWKPGPSGTRSYAVTVYDPDAMGGYWHWAVVDLPSDVTTLPEGAGSKDGGGLPHGATQAIDDAGSPGYVGAAPPAGDPVHHYHLVVTALDVATLEVGSTGAPSASAVATAIDQHALARGEIVATAVRAG